MGDSDTKRAIPVLLRSGVGVASWAVEQLRHQVERVAGQLRPASRPVAPGARSPEPVTPAPRPVGQQAEIPSVKPGELVDVPAEIERDATPVDHDSLPLPDFDHMSLGSLRGRLRTLDVVSLVQLRDWERAHGNRAPILTMIENRLAKVLEGDAPVPEGGAPQPEPRDVPPPAPGKPTISPAKSGPPLNPPSHGVPTNPAQPRHR